jgi:thioredoxin reductase (NADPH)
MGCDEMSRVEVAVVGAGPIGLELAAALKRAGVDYVQFDARQIGHTFTWWPRETRFFSTSERVAIAGIPVQTTDQQQLTGEGYLAYLRAVVEQLDLCVHTYERVTGIERSDGGFVLRTQALDGERAYWARRVVLAKGNMDAPNELGIPGEDLPHVSHVLRDPHDYFRKRLLVVGGKNSALEAALRCWRAGGQVTLSYRRAEFEEKTVKSTLLPDIRNQIRMGTVGYLPQTMPVEIVPGRVVLAPVREEQPVAGERIVHETDFVLLCTGFAADVGLFQVAGVRLRGPGQVPEFDPQTMETNVPGLYVAGTAATGNERRYRLFIENSHEHVARIVEAITGTRPEQIGTIAARNYELPFEDMQSN